MKRLLAPALLALSLQAPAHDPVLVPPTPWGVNPCEMSRVRCPLGLRLVHKHLVQAMLDADTSAIDYWQRRLRTWYAYNPDYRPHYHPHR